MKSTTAIKEYNLKALTGKLRPSGRFSIVQLPVSKSRGFTNAKVQEQENPSLRDVQDLDTSYRAMQDGHWIDLFDMPNSDQQGRATLGSSNATNSDKRAKRGSKGISPRQRDILCWGANALEQAYGKRCLSFLTYTLPPLSARDFDSVRENWKLIVEYAQKQIKRELEKHGITSSIVGCTELQMERATHTGRFYPHLHLVFRGKLGVAHDWAIEPSVFRSLWESNVSRFLTDPIATWEASENVQPVRKSVGGYLAKYISKCASKSAPHCLNKWHPSDWILVSRRVRSLYEKLTYAGYECGKLLYDVVANWTQGIGYKRPIVIKTEAYGERVIGQYGWLKGETVFPSYQQLHCV